MKAQKLHIISVLLVAAVAAPVSGQVHAPESATVVTVCEEPCYVAPFFKGEGGFVAKASFPGREVSFIVTCGSVAVTGTARQNRSGVVRQIFSRNNGLACDAEDGKIEIEGILRGGWYWLNDEKNSAVASLMDKRILDLTPTIPFDPGGVTFISTEGGAASFIKHDSSGRVGILPHILPGPEFSGVLCGGSENLRDGCLLSAKYAIIVTRPGSDGKAVEIGASLTRPKTGDYTLTSALGGRGFLKLDPSQPVVAHWSVGHEAGQDIDLSDYQIEWDFEGNSSQLVIEDATDAGERCHKGNLDRGSAITVAIALLVAENIVPAPDPPGPETIPIFRSLSIACPAL
jgi:hypothetical protein